MYGRAFPDAHTCLVGDIFELDHNQVPTTTLATCSFPCTDLSLAGKQAGMRVGKQSSAFWGFIRILEAQADAAPSIVLLENVMGWLTSQGGRDFRTVIQALNALGYRCDVFAVDALHFTPQSRPRVFVVGTRHGEAQGMEGVLSRSHALAPDRLKATIASNADLGWHWFPIPDPPSRRCSGLSEIVERLPADDPRWWGAHEVSRHLAMMSAEHRAHTEHLAGGYWYAYRTMYRRMRHGQQRAELRSDDVAGCLRTASGGSARQMIVRAGMGEVRMRHMTSREYARLQGVPDSYPIHVRETEALNGFGDAVCVPVILWIARHVLAQAVVALQLNP
jgi:DNA (cytosine-5)-methyltransferase 1